MALKGAHEAEVRKLTEQISALTRDGASLRASHEAVQKELEEAKKKASGFDALQKQLTDTQATLATRDKEFLTLRRAGLASRFSLDAKTLESLSPAQLDALEAVLPAVKTSSAATPNGKGFDMTQGSSGGNIDALSAREKIAAGLAADNRKPSS
jgi:chromosome segregation ATPase